MNPNIDRNTLAQLDHHDYSHDSGLPVDYFHAPDHGGKGIWLVLAAIAVVLALTGLCFMGWIA